MKSSQEDTFFSLAAANVYHRVEQVSTTLRALKWFGDQLVMVGQVRSGGEEKMGL